MKDIESNILRYGQLSAREKEEVDSYVASHPKWKPLLSDVKALSELAAEAEVLRAVPPGEKALAYYAVAKRFQQGTFAEPLRSVFERIEVHLDRNEALRERLADIEERIDETIASLNPGEQFERLTGHKLPETSGPAGTERSTTRTDREAAPTSPSRTSSASSSESEGSDFATWVRRRFRPAKAMRWGLAGVVMLLVAYGALFVFSQATQSDLEALALMEPSEMQLEGYELRTRGATSSAQQAPDAMYRRALIVLRQAHVSTLGLFPRYEPEKLKAAEGLLTRVVEREDAGSFVQLEAHFFLGKINLAQGETKEARSHFKHVVRGEGRRAADALNILTELQKIAPAENGGGAQFDAEDTLPTGE